MKGYVETSVEPVLHSQTRESYYSVPGEKAALQRKKWVATVVCVMSGINIVLKIFTTVSRCLLNNDRFPNHRKDGSKRIRDKGY